METITAYYITETHISAFAKRRRQCQLSVYPMHTHSTTIRAFSSTWRADQHIHIRTHTHTHTCTIACRITAPEQHELLLWFLRIEAKLSLRELIEKWTDTFKGIYLKLSIALQQWTANTEEKCSTNHERASSWLWSRPLWLSFCNRKVVLKFVSWAGCPETHTFLLSYSLWLHIFQFVLTRYSVLQPPLSPVQSHQASN